MADRIDHKEAATFEIRGNIAIVTLNRPEAGNSLNTQMHVDVVPMWEEINENPDIKVGIMTGAGDRAFCAGRDLREYVGTYASGDQAAIRRVDNPDDPMFQKLCNHFHIKKPMIAALNGYAVGGGLQMSLMADIRIMADDTYVAAMQGKANVTGGAELAYYFPWSIANYILMGNARISAQQCLQLGFVVKICPRAELIDSAIEIANQIMASGPDAIRYFKEESLKRQVMSGGLRSEEELAQRREEARARILRMRENPDLIEGMKAFVENRSADYDKNS